MQFVTAIRFCTTVALLTITSVSHADNITLGSFGNSPANLVNAPSAGIGQCLFSVCSYGPASYGPVSYSVMGPMGVVAPMAFAGNFTSLDASAPSTSPYSMGSMAFVLMLNSYGRLHLSYESSMNGDVVSMPMMLADQFPSLYSSLASNMAFIEEPFPTDPVPEPSALALLLSGLLSFALLRRWASRKHT